MSRYHRQTLLPQINPAGQAKLAAARVLLIGCGALGTTIADQLVRAGVGYLKIVDRDLVEWTNLQRQVLFDEADAAEGAPKAVAAARRLSRVNSSVVVEPVVADVDATNVEALAGLDAKDEGGRIKDDEDRAAASPSLSFILPPSSFDVILDGTDNAETRYLVNDVAVKHNVPWVYGACVGVEGRVMVVRPGKTPCLRCVFREPPSPGELPTCDTVGVLGPAAAVVGAMQAVAALQLLIGIEPPAQLVRLDLWRGRFGATPTDDARRPDCPCCGRRRFDFLDAPAASGGGATSLCGRDAIQVRPAKATKMDLTALAERLSTAGDVQQTPHLLKCRLAAERVSLTVFPDGRAIVHGVVEPALARSIYARWIGT